MISVRSKKQFVNTSLMFTKRGRWIKIPLKWLNNFDSDPTIIKIVHDCFSRFGGLFRHTPRLLQLFPKHWKIGHCPVDSDIFCRVSEKVRGLPLIECFFHSLTVLVNKRLKNLFYRDSGEVVAGNFTWRFIEMISIKYNEITSLAVGTTFLQDSMSLKSNGN